MHEYELKHNGLLNLLQSLMTRSRYEHAKRVAEVSIELAQRFEENMEFAWLAGVAHDCCRDFSEDEMYELGKKSGEILGNLADIYLGTCVEKILYHGLAAVSVLEEKYPLHKDVYNAIASHTIGHPVPSALQKIIYVADTMEPERNMWDETQRVYLLKNYTLNELVLEVISTLDDTYYNLHEITIKMRDYIQEQYEK